MDPHPRPMNILEPKTLKLVDRVKRWREFEAHSFWDWRSLAPLLSMSATTMAIGRPWTPDEDNQLRLAVATHGEIDNWKTVALSVPGRTNKACRKVRFTVFVLKSPNGSSISDGCTLFHPLSESQLGQRLRIVNFWISTLYIPQSGQS